LACLLSCKWTSELQSKKTDSELQKDADDIKFSDILVVIKKNRAFVGISLAGLGSTIAQYTGATLGIYMYRDVLGALPLMGIATAIGMVMSFFVLTLAPKSIKKFGLDKTVQTSLLIAMVLFVCQFFATLLGPIPYIVCQSVATTFSSVPILMQWGMVGDAIDYNEMITGKRTDGSIYGTFNLSRRFGQAIGSAFAAAMLGVIAFVPGAATQTAGALMGIKLLVVGVPFLSAILSFVALKYVWNITPDIRRQMAEFRKNKEISEN
ncbi:MAG: MFS transporter, partial [Oscillospiraceae bacterium]